MLVSDAAKLLGMSPQTLRLGLQQGLFPFGVAIKTSPKRYTYYINSTALGEYLNGTYARLNDEILYNAYTDSI